MAHHLVVAVPAMRMSISLTMLSQVLRHEDEEVKLHFAVEDVVDSNREGFRIAVDKQCSNPTMLSHHLLTSVRLEEVAEVGEVEVDHAAVLVEIAVGAILLSLHLRLLHHQLEDNVRSVETRLQDRAQRVIEGER